MLRRRLLTAGLAALSTVLLSACAASGGSPGASERQHCESPRVVVCTGGTVSKTGGVRDREPRICECRDPDPLE